MQPPPLRSHFFACGNIESDGVTYEQKCKLACGPTTVTQCTGMDSTLCNDECILDHPGSLERLRRVSHHDERLAAVAGVDRRRGRRLQQLLVPI